MAEQLADRDVLFARGGELGPVGRDRLVVVDQAAVGEPVEDHRGEALGRGEAEGLRLGAPGAAVRAVLPTNAEIRENAVAGAQDDGAAARPAGHQAAELLGERLESRCDPAA